MKLTAREDEIVRCIHAAMTNKEIAKKFNISEETVKRHLSNIFNKIGCGNRLELLSMTLRMDEEFIRAYRCPGCGALFAMEGREGLSCEFKVLVDGVLIAELPRMCELCGKDLDKALRTVINEKAPFQRK